VTVQPNLETWDRDLLALADDTERVAGRTNDPALKSRLLEIAAEVREMAQLEPGHGGEWPPGIAEPSRACCLFA
jgi:hypothetical protein